MSELEPQLRSAPASEPSLQLSSADAAREPNHDGTWRLSAADRIVPVPQEHGGNGGLLALAGVIAAIGAGVGYLLIGSASPPPQNLQASSSQPALIEPVSPAKPTVAEAPVPPPAPAAVPVETGALPAKTALESEPSGVEAPVVASAPTVPESPAAEPPPAPAIVNAAPPPASTPPAVASVPSVAPPKVAPAPSAAPAPVAKPNIVNSGSGTTSGAPPKKSPPSEPRAGEQKVARADLPAASGLKSQPLPPVAPAPRAGGAAMAPLPPVTDGRPPAPPPLRPASVDSRDPLQMRAAAVGLHPQLPSDLLARLSPDDFHNAEVAIRTAVAETPEGTVYVYPRQPWPDAAQFRVRLVRAARPDCHRYIVTITKDGWTTTAPPMETCDGPVRRF